MADTTFVSNTTVITAEWLNDINDAYYDYNVLKYISRSEWAAIKGGYSTLDCTAAIQMSIDAVNALYLGGTYGGGAGDVYLPAGKYNYTGIVRKKGVNLVGDGPGSTLLVLKGASSTGMKTPAAGTLAAADVVSDVKTMGIGFISGESAPVAQIQWNMIGFTRCVFTQCNVEWFGGCQGLTMLNATLAGSGGPANWYNTFYDVNIERLASRPSGGIGAQLGDTDIGKEQITTYKFIGGRVSGAGSGTGMQVRGTGNIWVGMTFEGCNTAITFGSTGTRGATGNAMIGCYYEGNTINREMRVNAENTLHTGSFITGGTDSDLSVSTTFHETNYYKAYIPNAAGNRWEVVQGGTTYRPTFSGSAAPGIDIKNSSNNYSTLLNAAASSTAWSWYNFNAVNNTVTLLELGQSGMRFGTDNALQFGDASHRATTLWATNGTIQTCDRRDKTDELPLSDVLISIGKELKGLMKTWRWIDSPDKIHVGPIAQDVIELFSKYGLDAHDFAMIDETYIESLGRTRISVNMTEVHSLILGAL